MASQAERDSDWNEKRQQAQPLKMKRLDKELVGLKLHLNIEMGFSNNWIDKVLVWSKMIFETIFFWFEGEFEQKVVALEKTEGRETEN